MSTYYKFVCEKCNKSGGFMSEQAWGIGNFDIISTFKFLALHKDHKPYLVCEHDGEYDDVPEYDFVDFLNKTKGVMPHSNDWELVSDNDWKDVEKKWAKLFTADN